MKRIPLTKGFYTIVDDEDFKKLSNYKWYYSHGYAVRSWHTKMINGKRDTKMILMHREIINTPFDKHTDHINHNKLDNRKINLRICQPIDNYHNLLLRKDNTSGFKGIVYVTDGKRKKRWMAQIRIAKDKRLNLGRFFTREEAAIAYNQAAKKYHGEFVRLNIIP